MTDSSTVARPYAKAVFELAKENNKLADWELFLKTMDYVSQDVNFLEFVKNPSSTYQQHGELALALSVDLEPSIDTDLVRNFLILLAENRRLQVLSEIYAQYRTLRAEYEKTMEVVVQSFSALTESQEKDLTERLSKKLGRSVSLKITIDRSLQGGAIIRAGHLVFDASVGTQIKKLSAALVA